MKKLALIQILGLLDDLDYQELKELESEISKKLGRNEKNVPYYREKNLILKKMEKSNEKTS